MTDLSEAALEEALNKTRDFYDAALEKSMAPLDASQPMGDVVRYGTGALYISTSARWMYVSPSNYWMATKILRGPGWHHKYTTRWRYLQKRGARK